MLKLYYKPISCSLAVHIALRELGIPFEMLAVKGDAGARRAGDADYQAINPLGAVPAVEFDDGRVMTEAAVILEYLGASGTGPALAPRPEDADYWDFRQVMNFIATDIHKNYGPLFIAAVPAEVKQAVWLDRMDKRFTHLAGTVLAKQPYLLARGYSVADIYLFVMLYWCSYVGVDLAKWPVLKDYFERISARPAVSEALAVETA